MDLCRIDRDWPGQCNANAPIQDQSKANRYPVLDWQFLVNQRKLRSILCNARANSFGANRGSARQIICCQSNANRPPVSFQPSADGLPIRWQSCANPFPILLQSVSNSQFNPVPIHHQSIHIFVLSFNCGNLQKMIIRHAHKIGAELNPPDIIIIIMPFLSFSVLIWSWVGDLAVFCIIAILIFSVWNW